MADQDKPLPGIKTEVLHVRVDSDMHHALKEFAAYNSAGITTAVRLLLRKQLRKEKLLK